jgi:hypothetical protein
LVLAAAVTLIVVPLTNVLAAQPALRVGLRAETLPPDCAVAVSDQQRSTVALSVLAAAGMLKLVLTVLAVDAPVHLSNT